MVWPLQERVQRCLKNLNIVIQLKHSRSNGLLLGIYTQKFDDRGRNRYLYIHFSHSITHSSPYLETTYISIYGGINKESGCSVQLLSHVRLFVTIWTAACQASLSITNSRSLLKLMSIESVMPSNHLILCRPLLLLPSIFPSIRVFSSESALCIRWPKYCGFSFNISPSNEYSGLISIRIDWLDLLAVQQTRKSFL